MALVNCTFGKNDLVLAFEFFIHFLNSMTNSKDALDQYRSNKS